MGDAEPTQDEAKNVTCRVCFCMTNGGTIVYDVPVSEDYTAKNLDAEIENAFTTETFVELVAKNPLSSEELIIVKIQTKYVMYVEITGVPELQASYAG